MLVLNTYLTLILNWHSDPLASFLKWTKLYQLKWLLLNFWNFEDYCNVGSMEKPGFGQCCFVWRPPTSACCFGSCSAVPHSGFLLPSLWCCRQRVVTVRSGSTAGDRLIDITAEPGSAASHCVVSVAMGFLPHREGEGGSSDHRLRP